MKKIKKVGLTGDIFQFLERSISRSGFEIELCGLLAGEAKDSGVAWIKTVLPLPNISTHSKSFAIDPSTFYQGKIKLKKDGQKVLALYHSHPDGLIQPSLCDLDIPASTNLLSLILTIRRGKMYAACFGQSKGKIYPVEVITLSNIS